MFGKIISKILGGKTATAYDVADIPEGILTGKAAEEHIAPLLKQIFERSARTTYIPDIEPEVVPGNINTFNGGMALLQADEAWPVCSICQQPMHLFVQLDLESLPLVLHEQFGTGILQVFYCTQKTDCAIEGDSWLPFDFRIKNLRILNHQDAVIQMEDPTRSIPVRSITGWTAKTDYPSDREHNDVWEGEYKQPMRVVDVALNIKSEQVTWTDYAALSNLYGPAGGEKIGGWPLWVQDKEYPACPKCGKEMHLLLQIDSCCNIDYMFGDSGTAHITQCPKHKDQLGFGWACF